MTLNWSINQARGQLSFGKLLPLAGNTYEVQLSGKTAGTEYTFYVMDETAKTCLAKSETNETTGVITIAFDQEALRGTFVQQWHEIRNFHTVVSDGTSTLAEGDLPICWNPVWTEPSTGNAYSMRGPQGVGINTLEYVSTDLEGNITYQFRLTDGTTRQWLAPRGPQGPATEQGYVYDELGDKKWHKIIVRTNRFGEKVLDVDPSGSETLPHTEGVVTIKGEQVITGAKAFSQPIAAVGGVTGNLTGNVTGHASQDALNSEVVKLTGDQTINGVKKFSTARGAITLPLAFDQEVTPTSSIYTDNLVFVDSQNRETFIFESIKSASGEQIFQIVNKKGSVYSTLRLSNDGTGAGAKLLTTATSVKGSSFAAVGMPSSVSLIDFAMGEHSSGDVLISSASANGWFTVRANSIASGGYIRAVCNLNNRIVSVIDSVSSDNRFIGGSIPIPKNSSLTIYFYGIYAWHQCGIYKASAENL